VPSVSKVLFNLNVALMKWNKAFSAIMLWELSSHMPTRDKWKFAIQDVMGHDNNQPPRAQDAIEFLILLLLWLE
jgi:hypothetical protein